MAAVGPSGRRLACPTLWPIAARAAVAAATGAAAAMAGAVMAADRVMAASLLTSFPAGAARLPPSCPLVVRPDRSAAAQEEDPAVEEAAAAAVVVPVVAAGRSAADRVMAVPLLTSFPAAAAALRLPATCPWTARSVRLAAVAAAVVAAVRLGAAVPVVVAVVVAEAVAEEAAVAGTVAGVAQSAAGLFCTLFPSPEARARRGRPRTCL